MAVPTQLGVVPLFILMSKFGWTGSVWSVVIPWIVVFILWAVGCALFAFEAIYTQQVATSVRQMSLPAMSKSASAPSFWRLGAMRADLRPTGSKR